MMSGKLSRRELLRMAGLSAAGAALTACQPKVVEVTREVEKVVTQVVKETVVVEGEAKEVTKVVEKVITTTPAPKAPIKIVMFKSYSEAFDRNSKMWTQEQIEKAFDVEFEFWWLEPSQWREQQDTRLAAGEIADLGNYDEDRYKEQGVVGKLCTISEFAQFCPEYFKANYEFDNNSLWCWTGGLYKGVRYTAGIYVEGQIYPFSVGWRTDYLEKAGLGIPETIDEWTTAFDTLTKQNICKYGVASPWGDAGRPSNMFRGVFGAYGTFPAMWVPTADGKGATYGLTTDGARQALETLHDWYAKGYIDPESVALKYADHKAKWCRGEQAVVVDGTWYRNIPGGEHYDCIAEAGGMVENGPAPKGPEGKWGYDGWGKGRVWIWAGRQVDTDYEKRTKILEVFGKISAVREWTFLSQFAKEEFTYRDDYGRLLLRPQEEIPDYTSWGFGLLTSYMTPEYYHWVQGPNFAEWEKWSHAGNTVFYPDLETFMEREKCKDFTELTQIKEKAMVDFVSGKREITDSEWNSFLDEYMANGGACWQEIADEGYKNQEFTMNQIRAEVESAKQLAGM